MKTRNINKPVFIPCHSVCSVVKNRLLSAQLDSKMTKSGMGVMRIMRIMGRMGWETKTENSPAQPYSKFSNGRLSGLLCWPHGQDIKNNPAQRDSRMTKFKILLPCPSECSVVKNRLLYAQPYSKMTKTGMGIMRITGRMGKRHIIENSPAQRDSKNSKFKKNQTLHSLHDLHGEEMYSAQQHSKFSKLGDCPFSPSCLFSPLASQNDSAQPNSKICNSEFLRPFSLYKSIKCLQKN